jgi:anti-sigma B factor antagonist
MLIRTWSLGHTLAILELNGRLTVESGSALCDAVSAALSEGRRHLVLNLVDIRWVDASGLGALANTLRMVRARRGELKLVTRSATIRELLIRTHLFEVFPTFASEAEAIVGFEARRAVNPPARSGDSGLLQRDRQSPTAAPPSVRTPPR